MKLPLKMQLIIPILAIAFAVGSCGISTGSFNTYSPADDVKFGNDLVNRIKADTKNYPISQNSALRQYVQSVVDQITASPEVKYKGTFAYKVEVIDRSDVINAFCCPGGYIFVYTGLLKFVPDEAVLAAVLAHEVGHAECRHATRRMTEQKGLESLVNLYKDKNKNKTTDAITGAVSGLGILANSRENEYEADECSVKYLRSTKWYPGAILRFFEKIKAVVQTGGNSLDGLLSTHPLPADRVDKVVALMKLYDINPPDERSLRSEEYAQKLGSMLAGK